MFIYFKVVVRHIVIDQGGIPAVEGSNPFMQCEEHLILEFEKERKRPVHITKREVHGVEKAVFLLEGLFFRRGLQESLIDQKFKDGVVVVCCFCVTSSIVNEVIQLEFVIEMGESHMAKILPVICTKGQRILGRDRKGYRTGFFLILISHLFGYLLEVCDRILIFFFQHIQIPDGLYGLVSVSAVCIPVSLHDCQMGTACFGAAIFS